MKFLEKCYSCLIYVFFVLYLVLIRTDIQDNKLIFYIGLLLAAIVLTIIPFFINHCKKISVRRWYLISFVTTGIFISFQSIYFILQDYIFLKDSIHYETINHIFTWFLIFLQALFITSFIFMLFFTIKDFFKKNYSIEKFDIDALLMCLNVLAYISIIYVLFDYSGYEIRQDINSSFTTSGSPYIYFKNYDLFLKGILLVSLGYILSYIIIKVISYYKFDKNNSKSNNIYK